MKAVEVDQSWLVILYSFLSHTLVVGFHISFGIIATELVSKRNFNQETVAWVTTLSMVTRQFFAFVSSSLYKKYGCRLTLITGSILYGVGFIIAGLSSQEAVSMFIAVGIIPGFGFSLVYIPTWIAATTYFKEKRQLANGLVMAGSPAGAALMPPFTNWLLDELGLPGTFLILAGIALNIIVIGALYPPLKTQHSAGTQLQVVDVKEANPTTETLSCNDVVRDDDSSVRTKRSTKRCCVSKKSLKFFRNWRYMFVVGAACIIDPILGHTASTYIPEFLLQSGYPSRTKWLPVSVMAIGNIVSRLTIGIKNKSRPILMTLYALSGLIIGLSLFSIPFASGTFPVICTLAGILGIGNGLYWSSKGPVLAEILPAQDFEKALGIGEVCVGFFMLLCPLQGRLFDVTGDFRWTFMMPGMMAASAGLVLMTLPFSEGFTSTEQC